MRVVHALETQLEEEVRVAWNVMVRGAQRIAPQATRALGVGEWTRDSQSSHPAHTGHVKLPKLTTNSLLIIMVRAGAFATPCQGLVAPDSHLRQDDTGHVHSILTLRVGVEWRCIAIPADDARNAAAVGLLVGQSRLPQQAEPPPQASAHAR
jgi:hypothetical protein